MKPSVVILTFNSIDSVSETISNARGVSDDIHVVDSGSTDGTLELLAEHGVTVHHHAFKNYGDQRNWAIDHLPLRYGWQLHLDADEVLSRELQEEIRALAEASAVNGFLIKRYLRFMGKLLRHNLAPTWHLRLFRTGKARCEEREYDQHFYCEGPTAQLENEMVDDISMSLSEWTARHNRWADAEVREILGRRSDGRIQGDRSGNPIEQRRFYRGKYDRAPLLWRAFALFFYRAIIKRGFLDGKEGIIFCVLQAFWFRFLIDAKLIEVAQDRTASPSRTPAELRRS